MKAKLDPDALARFETLIWEAFTRCPAVYRPIFIDRLRELNQFVQDLAGDMPADRETVRQR